MVPVLFHLAHPPYGQTPGTYMTAHVALHVSPAQVNQQIFSQPQLSDVYAHNPSSYNYQQPQSIDTHYTSVRNSLGSYYS
jgi:hypothetical protein